jgi:outer membrane protein TolC
MINLASMLRVNLSRSLALALLTLLVLPAGGSLLRAQAPTGDSLTLERAVAMALDQSPAIRGAREGITAAQARTNQLRSAYYPRVEADASFTRIDPTISVDFPINGEVQRFSFSPNNNYEAALRVSETLFDFGRRSAQIEVARFGEQSAADNVDVVRSGLAFQVVQSFYTALLLQHDLAVQDEQIGVLRSSLEVAKKKESEGSATSYDVLSTQVRLTTLENQRSDINRDLVKQQAQLRRLIGLPLNAPVALQGDFRTVERSQSADSLVAVALRTRTELVAARDAVHTAELQLNVARTGETPTIGVSVSGGVKNGYPPELDQIKPNWAGAVQLAVPIFNGFRTRYQEEEAESNLRAAQERLRDLEAGISLEVEQASADLAATYTKISAVNTQVEQAREALQLAQLRYANGVITNTELLNAQATLQETEFLRTQALYGNVVSSYALDRAIGSRIW